MRRPENAVHRRWDDPFWHALRLLIDQRGFSTVEEHEVLPRLRATGAASALGLADWLESSEPALIGDLANYTHTRWDLAIHAMSELLRTEEEAQDDFRRVSSDALLAYGTRQAHHQSSKVLVQTVAAIATLASDDRHVVPDLDPQRRAAHLANGHLWVSPRRLDGALPSLMNPVGLWEIKEYWGKTSGGSKMSDAIYELQLVGTELALQERHSGVHVEHIAILDGKIQWSHRRSDLRRAIDLLYCGLLDELILGREVMSDWECAVRRMWALVDDRW